MPEDHRSPAEQAPLPIEPLALFEILMRENAVSEASLPADWFGPGAHVTAAIRHGD